LGRIVTLRIGVTLMVLAAVSAASAWSATSMRRTFVLDATILQAGESGPSGLKPGHVESATGITRDVAGHPVGRFSSSCAVLKTLAKGDALLRCSGFGVSADGRLSFAGTVRASNQTPTLPITGATGNDSGARGTITEYPITQKETLVEIVLTSGKARVGAVPRPAANAGFRTRADNVCAVARRRLASVHLFPFADFLTRRPSPTRMRGLGKYLVSADARPVLRALDNQLAALGAPPADRVVWTHFLVDRSNVLAATDALDRAALGAKVDAFVKAVQRGAAAERAGAISALVFGASGCML
jgi:hypothetical protein